MVTHIWKQEKTPTGNGTTANWCHFGVHFLKPLMPEDLCLVPNGTKTGVNPQLGLQVSAIPQ